MSEQILVLNHEEELLELYDMLLSEEGFTVLTKIMQTLDLAFVREMQPKLIIIDHLYGNYAQGWTFIQKLWLDRNTANIPIIVCSGEFRKLKELEEHLKDKKNIILIVKPFDISELLAAVQTFLHQVEKVPVQV